VPNSDSEEFLAKLVQIRDVVQQRDYIADSDITPALPLIEALSLRIRDTAWKDPALAEILVESISHLAGFVNSPAAWAYATRSRAQVLHTMRKCAEAQPHFERAVQLFREAGLEQEAGRTTVTEMENLAYLGRYEEAIHLAGPARAALEAAGDRRYLTLVDASLGNLYYRLKRYTESLDLYERARSSSQNPESTAAIGMGRAHVLNEMNRFDEALEAYKVIKEYCEQQGLSVWVDIIDRGISRMYLYRGNYSQALRAVEQIRRKHESAGDSRRVALCDLDRTEIFLQLNLFEDAADAAGKAFGLFQDLGNRYEAAVALTSRGVAKFKQRQDAEAQADFDSARKLFVEEGNETWVAAVDLWLAQLFMRRRAFAEAGVLARHSAEAFERQHVPVRAANARILSAQTLHEMHNTTSAVEDARRALQELEGFHAPWVSYQALNTLGRLREWEGAIEEAEEYYLKAIAELELMRGNIQLDELRMSFGKDKYQVYENLVAVKLKRGDAHGAFEFVERSKSRTLLDLMERNLATAWEATDGAESPKVREARRLREELNVLYSRLNEVGTTAREVAADTATKQEIANREHQLSHLLREIGSEKPGWASLQTMPSLGVTGVQATLENEELLLEYYAIGSRLDLFVVGPNKFQVITGIASASDIRSALKGLYFQLSKFHLRPDYLKKHARELLAATRYHLEKLHTLLIAPAGHLLRGAKRLVIVPHQMLHYVPFHAVFDGERYLVDTHELTVAASSSVFRICRNRRPEGTGGKDLIMGVWDELTPHIDEEIKALRKLMPDADVFTGKDANVENLRQYGRSAARIHIAAHAVFRADSPMFSALRLGNEWLNLFDIFNLRLGSEITTLSACETGVSAVWEGDELLGLARGFLYAGTPSLVVSLWTVNDLSTSHLMRRFYRGLQAGQSKAAALREAILAVKQVSPHPYFWAPFVLMGKP